MVRLTPLQMARLRMQLLRRRFPTSAGKPKRDQKIKAISDFIDGEYSQALRNSAQLLVAAGVYVGLGKMGLEWYRGDKKKEADMFEDWRKLKSSNIVAVTDQLVEIKGALQGIHGEMKVLNKNAEEEKDRIWFHQIPEMKNRV